MCLIGRCDCYEESLKYERSLRYDSERAIYRHMRGLEQRVKILERMFKESKPYKRAECEVLREHAEQG
jgi:hypothetical protein